MSKAEELSQNRYPTMAEKYAFIDGYEQAEEDLIDKAIGWITEIYNYHEIMRYSDSCEPPLSELTEWFKNYMKEENINLK